MSDTPTDSNSRRSKVISKDELSAFQRWELPVMEGDGRSPTIMTAKQLEQIHQQAYNEGFAEGRRAGEAALRAEAQRLVSVFNVLQAPLKELDQQVEQELIDLAFVVARQLVRREIKTDPGAVVAAVREALSALPVAARRVQIALHPEDAELVRQALHLHDSEQTYKIVEDPVLSRGDCRVTTESSRIDATIESRLNALMSAAFGGERKHD